MPLSFAHFSDLHLGRRDLGREHALMRGLVDHALEAGAGHLLFGGDLVDHGNLRDARALRDHLAARGYLTAERASLVPGNHDVWPFGEGRLVRDALQALPQDLLARLRGTRPSERRRERFARLFAETFEGAQRMGRAAYPCVKQLDGVSVALVDSSSRRGLLHSAEGRFDAASGHWIEQALRETGGARLLLMHHTPVSWEVSRAYLLSLWPKPLRRWVETRAPQLLDVELGFRDQPVLEEFLHRARIDAVLCGHLHLLGDPRGAGYDSYVAGVPIHVMGRSGGVHQTPGEEVLAYHLGRIEAGRVSLSTVFVEARALLG